MTYSHRNGETEPPTIYESSYWILSEEDSGMVYVMPDGSIVEPITFSAIPLFVTDVDYQWWGPVTPPWEASDDS